MQRNAGLKLQNSELRDELEQQKICMENERKQHRTAKQTFDDKEREMGQVGKSVFCFFVFVFVEPKYLKLVKTSEDF